ncbi:hypothetical protein F1529_12160 [Alcanivorax sp. VBW004]|uniref:hypothetical protein n=1 Tax=Alcanivorax sp. VBW004 TaxID=1287708 RepID=UPI0012BC2945|nr:hypothetical protein [Alcanivorax sp. VBW004]MTT53240.1 hypothetical protein [Alcanivorax sp. VBW004]
MDRPRDYADGELRGLERYFPTPLSRVLLVSLLTAPAGTFWLILENSERLFPGYEDSFQNLVSAMVALTLAFFILLALAIDLIVVAHHSKHRRIVHYSNRHPQMSFSWLWNNAQVKHFIFLAALFTLGVLCGQCL